MSSIIKVDQIQLADGSTPTAADLGLNTTGSVLQVVTANTTTEVSTTSNSYSDTGLTASITPSSTSSKIWVSATVCIDINSDDLCDLKLLRDSTDILETGYNGYHSDPSSYMIFHTKLELLDSPNTTSQVTYKVQFKRGQGDNTLYVNYDDATGDTRSFITLMEIAG
jgi:hypothetical protein